MKCVNCIHYDVCSYHIDEETPELTVNECPHGFKHKDQYMQLPAYVGQPVWRVFTYYYSGDVEVIEGKVSMIQQKADKSWKFRVTMNGSVRDYTINDIGTYIFFDYDAAIERANERERELKS